MTEEKFKLEIAGRQAEKTDALLRAVEAGLNERDVLIIELKTVLCDAQKKLQLYREHHSGEYIGGVEFRELMSRINAALNREWEGIGL